MRGYEANALVAELGELQQLVAALSESDFACATRCPGWSVAEIVAHCEGMLLRLANENAEQVEGRAEIDRVGYYRYDPDERRDNDPAAKTFSEIIRDRAVDAVAGQSSAQLQAALAVAIADAVRVIAETPGDRVVRRTGRPRMTFGEFVAARVVEFGVHTMDIEQALGRPEGLPTSAASTITGILDNLLASRFPISLRWDPITYILTGTGRRELTPEERAKLGRLAGRFPLIR